VLANGVWFGVIDAGVLVSRDSASYLGFTPERTVGYPLFLQALGSLYPGSLAVVQLNLHLAAVAGLGITLARTTPWRWVGFAVMVMLASHGAIQQLAVWHLSDSLFVTLSIATLTAAGRLIATGAPGWAFAAGALCACAILVRPAGYYLIGVLAFVALTLPCTSGRYRASPGRLVAALIVPLAATLLVAASANAARWGVFSTQVIGGYSLVGHVAVVIESRPASPYPELASRLAERVQPVVARRPEHPWPRAYQHVTTGDYNELLWDNLVPEIAAWVAVEMPEADPRVAISAVASALGTRAILDHPVWYLRHVTSHFIGLAAPLLDEPGRFDLDVAWATAASNEELSHTPQLLEAGIEPSPEGIVPVPPVIARLLWLLNLPWVVLGTWSTPLLALLGIAVPVCASLALLRPSPLVAIVALFGIACVGYLLLVAAVQVALPRYTLAGVPAALSFLLLLGGAAADRAATTMRQARA
jgi:hypothetical protein